MPIVVLPQNPQTLTISGTVDSTSTNSGSLQVLGGTGIGGSLNVGGNVTLSKGPLVYNNAMGLLSATGLHYIGSGNKWFKLCTINVTGIKAVVTIKGHYQVMGNHPGMEFECTYGCNNMGELKDAYIKQLSHFDGSVFWGSSFDIVHIQDNTNGYLHIYAKSNNNVHLNLDLKVTPKNPSNNLAGYVYPNKIFSLDFNGSMNNTIDSTLSTSLNSYNISSIARYTSFTNSSNNTGIGTNSPVRPLQVNGTICTLGQGFSSGSNKTGVVNNGGNITVSIQTIVSGLNGSPGVGSYIFSIGASSTGQFFANGILYNWNPNVLAVTTWSNNGITVTAAGNSGITITNSTGNADSFIINLLNIGHAV